MLVTDPVQKSGSFSILELESLQIMCLHEHHSNCRAPLSVARDIDCGQGIHTSDGSTNTGLEPCAGNQAILVAVIDR